MSDCGFLLGNKKKYYECKINEIGGVKWPVGVDLFWILIQMMKCKQVISCWKSIFILPLKCRTQLKYQNLKSLSNFIIEVCYIISTQTLMVNDIAQNHSSKKKFYRIHNNK